MSVKDSKTQQMAPLGTPSDLPSNATKDISGALTTLLADMFALYLKTKNFHWHMSGQHFRDYHLLLDEQGEQIFSATDPIAERVRKIGGTTLRSIGQIGRLQRVLDNDADYVTPLDMLAELRDDNKQLAARMRETHGLCDEHGDVASASLLETSGMGIQSVAARQVGRPGITTVVFTSTLTSIVTSVTEAMLRPPHRLPIATKRQIGMFLIYGVGAGICGLLASQGAWIAFLPFVAVIAAAGFHQCAGQQNGSGT
jgi:starvation-inducible DNA-binding protein